MKDYDNLLYYEDLWVGITRLPQTNGFHLGKMCLVDVCCNELVYMHMVPCNWPCFTQRVFWNLANMIIDSNRGISDFIIGISTISQNYQNNNTHFLSFFAWYYRWNKLKCNSGRPTYNGWLSFNMQMSFICGKEVKKHAKACCLLALMEPITMAINT